jgi:Flp pilus assembly protein CpaB
MDTWIKIPAILCLFCIGIIAILGIVSLRVPEETLIVNVYDISTNSTLQNVNVVLTDLESGKTMGKDLVSGRSFPVTANHSYQYRISKEGYANRTGTFTLDYSPPYSMSIRMWRPIPLKLAEIRPSGAYTMTIRGPDST